MNTTRFRTWGLGLTLGAVAAGGLVSARDDSLAALEARLESARSELREAERARMDAFQAAETATDQRAALDRNPWKALRERFDALAFEAEGTEVAAGAWSTIFLKELEFGTEANAWEAFGVLIHDYPDSTELESVVTRLAYVPPSAEVIEGLRELLELSSTSTVKGGALFSLARLLAGSDETHEEALGMFRQVASTYADVDDGRGRTLGEMASAALYEAEHLQVGMSVPDFTATDETGSSFNLSDYEGKVVLLDFWGFW